MDRKRQRITSDLAVFEQLVHTYKAPLDHVLLRMTEQEEAVRLLKGAFVKIYEVPYYDETMPF